MPRIKLTAIVAGPDYRGQPGEIIEVSHKDAQQLIMASAALPQVSHDDGRATDPGPAAAGNGKPDGPEDVPAKAETGTNGGPGVVLNSSGGEPAAPVGTVTSDGQAADAPAAKPAKKPKK